MLHREITGKILEASFEVSKELGSGFLESVYEKALSVALVQKGLRVRTQIKLAVEFRGVNVGNFCADIIVNDVVMVELKAVSRILPEHKAQVINYLKATGMKTALLINFGNPKIEYHRLFQ
jgi:GxxExxY protein